jgi:hypothetical protein
MDKVVLYASDDTIGIVTLLRPSRRSVDIVAPLYASRTEVGQRFNEITRKDRLVAALEWRTAPFAE